MQFYLRARAPTRKAKSSLALGLNLSVLVATFSIAPLAFAQSPPVVGRPIDFSGAVGGPFVAQWVAESTELMAEQPLTLTLRITGPGNLQDLPRPAISKLDSFRAFAIEDRDDRFVAGDPPLRDLRYRVRPRSTAVKEIPRFKFVYFNPRIVPPSRGYQTTYAEAVPLTVKPQAPAGPSGVPVDVPNWMLEPPASDELFGPPPKLWQQWLGKLREKLGVETDGTPIGGEWILVILAVLVPPALCRAWLAVWRLNPDTARLAAGRRSRAATAALQAFRRAGNDRAELIAAALAGYLRDRAGLPSTATTPNEIAASLTALGCPARIAVNAVALFHRCDAVRFAALSADATLAADATKVVLEWEAAPWAGPDC
jgi:hypothetical protein